MKDDLTIQYYLEQSDKADLLEFVKNKLGGCIRGIVIFESPHPTIKGSIFEYHLFGFKQTYEVQGFLAQSHELIEEEWSEDEDS